MALAEKAWMVPVTQENTFSSGNRPIGIVTPLYPDHPVGSSMSALMKTLFGQMGMQTVEVNAVTAPGVADNVRIGVLECLQAGVCGVVLSAVYFTEVEEMAETIRELLQPLQIPFVCIFYRRTQIPALQVYYDNRDAGAQAASHLLSRGWTELRFVEPYRSDWSFDRLTGVRGVASLHPYAFVAPGPGEAEGSVLALEGQMEAAYRLGRELFLDALAAHRLPLRNEDGSDGDAAQGTNVTPAGKPESLRGAIGIVAANDSTAIGVMRAGNEYALKPGYDYAIVGFDDDAASAAIGLTSLRPPWSGMAEAAVVLLCEHLAGITEHTEICLRSNLISRASTASRWDEARYNP